MTTGIRDIRDACDLSDDELADRRSRLGRELFAHARGREALPSGLAIYFEDTPALKHQLDEFVEFERVCCSGINWSVGSNAGSLRLEIDGIDPKAEMFAAVGQSDGSLSDQSVPTGGDAPGFWPRLLRAVGFGSLGGLFVCCALPLGVAAVIGATPLLLLDNPWAIAGSAIALGGYLWHREGRRSTTRAAAGAGPDCGC